MTEQLLEQGNRVVGTVRDTGKVDDLRERYPETFRIEVLDVTDTAAMRDVVERSFARLERVDVIVSNAGYGLFGAAEELSDEQIDRQPTSSPKPKKTKLANQYGNSPRKENSSERPNSPISGHPPNKKREITAAARNRIGAPAAATTYHPSPTRQRNTRLSSSRTPIDPLPSAVTTKAETMGPRLPTRWKRADDVCGSEVPRERNTAGAHTTHEKAYASAKKSTKGCLRASGLTPTCMCGSALSP
jgi:hypothetical protein